MSQNTPSKTFDDHHARTDLERDDSKSVDASASDSAPATKGPIAEERKSGAERIEALYTVFGGKNGASIWLLYFSLALFFYAYSLASNTVSNYLAFATSAFGEHTVLSTISTMVYIIGAVGELLLVPLEFRNNGSLTACGKSFTVLWREQGNLSWPNSPI